MQNPSCPLRLSTQLSSRNQVPFLFSSECLKHASLCLGNSELLEGGKHLFVLYLVTNCKQQALIKVVGLIFYFLALQSSMIPPHVKCANYSEGESGVTLDSRFWDSGPLSVTICWLDSEAPKEPQFRRSWVLIHLLEARHPGELYN